VARKGSTTDAAADEIDTSVAQLLRDLREKKITPGAELDAHIKVLNTAIKWSYVKSKAAQPKWGSGLGSGDLDDPPTQEDED